VHRLLLCLALAGCHNTSRVNESVLGQPRVAEPSGPGRQTEPALLLGEAGTLRLVHPLVCDAAISAEERIYQTTRVEPNLATMIVGVIVLATGVVSGSVGLSDDEPAGSPYSWLGAGGVGVGLPLVVGPFLGNHTTRARIDTRTVPRGEKPVPCGDAPVEVEAALLSMGNQWIFGTVSDGVFQVPVFDFVDAFAVHELPALRLEVEPGPDPARRFQAVIEAGDLARAREAYFAALGRDGSVERLRKVPSVEATGFTATRTTVANRPAIRFAVRFHNAGPGDAWGVRGEIQATHPAIDGRFLYAGALPAGASATAEVTIPIASPELDVLGAAVQLTPRDAHDTISTVPVKLRGPLLVE
jgi:hypothetical protein